MALVAALVAEPIARTGDMDHTTVLVPTLTGLQEPEPGWVLCNGAAVPNSGKYVALYALLGTLYGAAGTLPNLIDGVQPVAKGATKYTAVGATDGARVVTLALAAVTNHIHSYNNETINVFLGANGWTDKNSPFPGDTADDNPNAFTTGAAGGGGSHNNMPPYLVVEGVLMKL